jgi:SPP1 family predicted phage head-tail adaptor
MSLKGKNPGQLDRRITLRFPVVTRDAIGGAIEGFGVLDPIWAGWLPAAGKEWFGAATKQSDGVDLFTVRYRSDITTTWRVFFQGVLYELVGQPIETGRRQYLDLPCRRLPDQSAGTLYATAQSFTVDLIEGDESKDIVFPNVFPDAPRGLMVQLLIPDDGFVFGADPVAPSITASGFTVTLGASVPGPGYKLSIQAAL